MCLAVIENIVEHVDSQRMVLNVPPGVLTSSRCCASTFAMALFFPSLTGTSALWPGSRFKVRRR